ncbi:MAG: VOC family protein [Thalassotalea sp.]
MSIGTNQLIRAGEFYQQLLPILGIELVSQYEHAFAFGKGYPEFWLQTPFDKKDANVGNGVHIGFVATSKKQVDEFYNKGIALGAQCNGKPGARPEYGAPYYGCFLIDLDGNKIEASYWQLSKK